MVGREFPSGCDSGTVLRLARSRSGTALTLRQLQYWDRTGLLSARTRQARGKRFYSFEDVLRLRIIVHLLESRLPTQRVRAAIENISRAAERVGRPWQTLRVVTDGNSVFVLDGDLALDALRNQLVSVVLLGDLTAQTRKVFARVAAGRHAA
jgi:DNA-binding transcriptional MerR regulator